MNKFALKTGRESQTIHLLTQCHWEWGYLLRECNLDLATLSGHGQGINSASFSPDGARIVMLGKDRTSARVLDAATGELVAAIVGHMEEINSVRFSPDGMRVVTASADETAKVWDAASGALVATLSGHSKGLNYACFSPDGARVVTASLDRTAKIWTAFPFRGEDLPGDNDLTWRERFKLWRQKRYQEWSQNGQRRRRRIDYGL